MFSEVVPGPKTYLNVWWTELSPLLHCSMPPVGGAASKFLLHKQCNWFSTFKFQRKDVPCTTACNFKIATKIGFHPKLHSC